MPASIDREDAALDVADAAIDLDRVVLAVEVVDHPDLAVVGDPGIRIAEIPTAAIVAHDQFRPPGSALVFAHLGANAGGHQPVAVDHHQPAVGQLDHAAG